MNHRMLTRTRGWRVALAAVMIGALFVLAGRGSAQARDGFSMVKVTFEGGGGQSAAGRFSLMGTIGQLDAGQLAGGRFALTGGYWSSLATEPTGQVGIMLWMPFLGLKSTEPTGRAGSTAWMPFLGRTSMTTD